MPHPSLVFRWFLIGYILGVGVWSVWRPSFWYGLVLAGLAMVVVGRMRLVVQIAVGVVLLGGAIGAGHIVHTLDQRTAKQVPGCCDQTVKVTGVIGAEPSVGIDQQTIVVAPSATAGMTHPAKVQVRLPLGQLYNYGDVVEVECLLRSPQPTDDFAYDKYLMLTNVRATCQANNARIIGRQSSQTVMRLIFQAKRWTTERLQLALPEPQAALMAGLLIGSRSSLPDNVLNDFRTSGVSHIVAISGYNITIIASMIFAATCRYLGRTRSFWLVTVVLIVFTIMTGASASVIRATIMGIMALTAKQVGRVGSISGVWLLAGFMMMIANPMVLVYDAGFQLSFLATAGLMWISPFISKYLRWVPETVGLRDSLASTLSATALTLPIMISNFRQVSLISPLVNMLILPLVPIIMAIGAVIIGVAAISATLSQVLGWFAWLGLSYILGVTHWLGNIPYAAMAISRPAATIWLIIYAGGLGLIIFGRKIIHRRKHAS